MDFSEKSPGDLSRMQGYRFVGLCRKVIFERAVRGKSVIVMRNGGRIDYCIVVDREVRAMGKELQRTVRFYWIRMRSRKEQRFIPLGEINWFEQLRKIYEKSWEEKTVDDITFEADLSEEYPILSAFEHYRPTYMHMVDNEHKRIEDIFDNDVMKQQADLAKSSAYAFFPEYSIVGRVSGNAGIDARPLPLALNHYFPMEGEWEVTPVVSIDSLERFEKELSGLKEAHLAFTTEQYIDPEMNMDNDAEAFYQRMARDMGCDLEVNVQIKLIRHSRTRKSIQKAFKNLMAPSVRSAAKQGTLAKIQGVDFADAALKLNLVKHAVVEEGKITVADDEPRQFSRLKEHLVRVCKERQEELERISLETCR